MDMAMGSDLSEEPARLPAVDAVMGSDLREAPPRLLPMRDESVMGMVLPE